MVGKQKLIGKVDNIVSYNVPYNSANVLNERLLRKNIVKKVFFICWKAKGNACWYFEITEKDVDLALHTQVVVESVAVKVAKLKSVVFQSEAIK